MSENTTATTGGQSDVGTKFIQIGIMFGLMTTNPELAVVLGAGLVVKSLSDWLSAPGSTEDVEDDSSETEEEIVETTSSPKQSPEKTQITKTVKPPPVETPVSLYKKVKVVANYFEKQAPNQKEKYRPFLLSEHYPAFQSVMSYVKVTDENFLKNKDYQPKIKTVQSMAVAAQKLKQDFLDFKPPVKSEELPVKITSTISASVSDEEVDLTPFKTQKKKQKRDRSNELKQTACDWLGDWDWTVNESGQSYFEKNISGHDIHISLPMKPEDSTELMFESKASGIWVGRAVHITWNANGSGKKNNPRIWLASGGWVASTGAVEPKNGCQWLLDNSDDLIDESGLEGSL